jgi:preprotein translocase subunit SecF
MENSSEIKNDWYNKWYKFLLVIPVIILIFSLSYLGYFYSKTGDFIIKDASLSGGTTITINSNLNAKELQSQINQNFPDVTIRSLTELRTGKQISLIIETSVTPEEIRPELEKILGYSLNTDNSSFEFTGSSLSESFYKQLIIALIISFILMSITVFVLFRTFIPSIAVIFAVLGDIIMPLALIDFLGIKLSAAGIAAFLMLIGYSVDTDLLLTTRALRTKEGSLNQRIFRAFKTGSFMNITALIAVLPAFIIVSGLPDSFRQIFLILALGLFADLINTWLTNASIIKWYCDRKGIK